MIEKIKEKRISKIWHSDCKEKGKMEKSPLRKIIEIKGNKELLECGHWLYIKQDIFGKTFPVKRRCWKCKKGK